MACLVIFVTDRSHHDPAMHALAHKRGDVIAVVPDDWPFSKAERMSSDWTIYRLPGVSVAEGESFLGGHYLPPGSDLLPTARVSRVDLARLPDDRSKITYADLDAARVMVELSPDPSILAPTHG